MSGRNKRKRRYDHFSVHSHCAHGQLKPVGGIAHCFAMPDAEELPQALLELLDARARIGEPATIHYLTDPLQKKLFIPDVRTADVKLLVETRFATENSEIIYAFLCQPFRRLF